jgi:SAM-dependent methyltransferase
MSTAVRQLRDAYDPFALIYNREMAEDFCQRAWPIVERLLLARVPKHSRLLDLCCGSGQMARELSQRDYRVTGLDGSEAMIAIAQQNAPHADFILADARSFSTAPTFDGVISTYNSLAHAATLDELTSILRNARAALRPNGTLLFDLSMEEAYTSKWYGSFGDAHADSAWIVRPAYDRDSRTATNAITVFRRNGNNTWQRNDFTIHQRCFSEAEIRSALAHAGFTNVSSYDAERDLSMTAEFGRRFFLSS